MKATPKAAAPEAASSMAQYILIIATFLCLNAGLNMTNKYALGIYGFSFPLLLTSAHMAFGFVMLLPLMLTNNYRHKHAETLRKQWKGLLAIGVLMAANIAFNNISLVVISLSLNQVIRSSIPVVAAIMAVLIEGKVPSRDEAIALVVLSAGVMVAVWEGTVGGQPWGIVLCVAATVANAAMMTTAGKIMSEKVDALRLTFYTAPVACAVLGPFFVLREAPRFWSYLPEHGTGAGSILLLSCSLALAYNIAHATMIHKLSAVTTTVLGEAKIVGLLILSALFLGEGREFTLKMTIGCGLAMFGFGKYSHCRLQQSSTATAGSGRPPAEKDMEKQQLLSNGVAEPVLHTDVPLKASL